MSSWWGWRRFEAEIMFRNHFKACGCRLLTKLRVRCRLCFYTIFIYNHKSFLNFWRFIYTHVVLSNIISQSQNTDVKKCKWKEVTRQRNIIQCPFIYSSFTILTLNIFFFKKFKYLLGTQVKNNKQKRFAKTKTKHV